MNHLHNMNARTAEAEKHDFYATDPRAVELLLNVESFNKMILEPACGAGHISKALEANHYSVISTDLYDRGYGTSGVDFLKWNEKFPGDIITNPPYRHARQFVEKALDVVDVGAKVAMFLKLTFLEGQARKEFFKTNPPRTIYVSSKRLQCAKNADFSGTSMIAYAWFVWEKGYTGATIIKWI